MHSASFHYELNQQLSNRRRLGIPRSPTAADTKLRDFSFIEQNRGGLASCRIETTAAKTITLGATGNRAGGVKLLDFNAMGIVPIMGRFTGSVLLTAGTATYASTVWGLGTTIATGNVNVLTGTAGFVDLGGQRAGSNIAAGATVALGIMFGGGGRDPIDGRAAAVDLHLNTAGVVAEATTNLTLLAGAVVDLWFAGLPAE